MPASAEELTQLKRYADAIRQLVESIEARYRVEGEPEPDTGAPRPQFARIK